ncbi:MAG: PAS domain S-box protein [Deltaproteobacteria bacterium]|nr:PAS domain S-box protein [Deltaproteobacteria bacterium]
MKKEITAYTPATWDQMVCRTADNIPCYIAYVTAKDLRYRYVNQKFESSFSKPCEEIIGSHIIDIIGQSNYEVALPFIEKVKSGNSVSYVNSFGLAEGRRWIKVSYAPDFGGAGEVVGIFIHCYDVTEHHQAVEKQQEMEKALIDRGDGLEKTVNERTEQLRLINQQLAKAEERYRTIADFAYDWETWEGPDGEMRYVSPSCERISGYTAQEFTKDPSLLRKIILPKDLSIWDRHIDRRQEKKIHELGPAVEFRIRRKDGSVRWIQHQCQPVMGEDGRYRGIRGSNRDTTRRRELEEEGARQRAELAHVSRVSALGELTASIAHELNQPLAAILCNAQAAQRFLTADPPDLNEVNSAISDIVSDERRADQVIRRLRKLLKRGDLEQEALDVNDVAREIVAVLVNEATNSNVVIQLNLAVELPRIIGDRIQLEQVVLNLAVNAVDALRNVSASERRVSITTGHLDSYLHIDVTDTGPGLPTEIEEDIFKPFVTTKDSGLGIGLSICKTIVEAHGGRLEGKNRDEGGALFRVTLPIAKEDTR